MKDKGQIYNAVKCNESKRSRLFGSLMEQSHDAIYIVDPVSGRFIDVNNKACADLGYTQNELLEMKVSDIEAEIPDHFCWDDHVENLQNVRSAVFKGMHKRKNKTIFPVEVSVTYIQHEAQDYMVAVVRNKSGQLEAKELVLWSYQTQKILSELLKLSVEDVGLDEMFDRALDLLYALPWLKLEAKGCIFLVGNKPDVLEMQKHKGLSNKILAECEAVPFGKCICGRAAASKEILYVDRVNELHDITYPGITPHGHVCIPILLSGRVIGLINLYLSEGQKLSQKEKQFYLDLSNTLAVIIARKKSNDALKSSRNELKQALNTLKETQQQIVHFERLRALGEMAGGIAHEFNNQLMVISGYCDILTKHPEICDDKEKRKSIIKAVSEASRDAAHVVNNMRKFYRPHLDDDVWTEIDINSIIDEVIFLTIPKWKSDAMKSGKVIGMEKYFGDISSISGNVSDLREVITNMIFNAVDAIDKKGEISFSTYEKNQRVFIEISDTGRGMSEDVRKKCFEPFYTTKRITGTGLGLSLAYGIIKRHDGTLEVESQENRGSVFTLSFPRSDGSSASCNEVESDEDYILPPLRILYVEDDIRVRDLISKYLRADGHTVETASNGMEALEIYNPESVDLVLTDMAMPEMDGMELSYAIKKDDIEKPVIMLTGFGDILKDIVEKPLVVDRLVSKPVNMDELKRIIKKVIRKMG